MKNYNSRKPSSSTRKTEQKGQLLKETQEVIHRTNQREVIAGRINVKVITGRINVKVITGNRT